MKKIALMLAIALSVFAFSSCKQNTEPRYKAADSMTLNTPPMANQAYVLSPDMTINLTWSQPDWGFAAVATYKVQIALEPEFLEYNELQTAYTLCNVEVPGNQMAGGINKLRGIAKVQDWTPEPARPVYVRIRGSIDGIEGSEVISNVITLSQVVGYNEILAPNKIYLIGTPGGWTVPSESNINDLKAWALSEPEDGIGSKVFSGSFSLPEAPIFRFYTALEGWDVNSLGAPGGNDDDNPVVFDATLADAPFESNTIATKDSFSFPNCEGCSVTMTVDRTKSPNTLVIVPNP